MSALVIDASVAVEILLRTRIGEAAWAMVGDAEVLAPDLIDAEVLAVLRREHLRGVLAAERATQALEDLSAWEIERIASHSLLAGAWRYRHNVSAYDALYLAAAQKTGAPILTADGPLARAAGLEMPITNVRDAPSSEG